MLDITSAEGLTHRDIGAIDANRNALNCDPLTLRDIDCCGSTELTGKSARSHDERSGAIGDPKTDVIRVFIKSGGSTIIT